MLTKKFARFLKGNQTKQQKMIYNRQNTIPPLVKALSIGVLLGGFLIIAILSYEVLNNVPPAEVALFNRIQFWICLFFMADFVLRMIESKNKSRFLLRNFLFFIVSIPFLTLIQFFEIPLSANQYYIIKSIPLIRGGYAMWIIVKWLTNRKASTLLLSYVMIIGSFSYFSALLFYGAERGMNPEVVTFWNAICWALMNVTTVGSPIAAQSVLGQALSILLAAGGMMMFPIFTVYITTIVRKRNTMKNKE